MVKSLKINVGLVVLMVSGTVVASRAQESITPTRQFRLNLSQTFNAIENQAQNPESAGTTYSAITRLGFSAITLNELNELNLSASTGFRFSDVPGSETVQEIDSPRLTLRYLRTGADSSLALRANYRRDDITFVRPLDDFINEFGELEVPDDINDLDGSGTRIDYGTNVRFQVRQNAPISLTFGFGIDGRQYEDTTDPDLFDVETVRGQVSAQFQFAPDFEGNLNYGRSEFRAEDDVGTQRDRENLSFGVVKTLSKVLSGRATIGQTKVETTSTEQSTSVTGGNGGIGLTLERPNGNIGLDFDNITNANGTRQLLVLRRGLALRDGNLSGSIGITRLEDGDREPIGSLRYLQVLPTGNLTLSYNRAVRFIEEDGADRDITSFTAAYNFDINQLSSVTLRGAATQSQGTDRSTLGVTYNYSLTKDWNLSTGYNFDVLTEDDRDSANRHRIFVGLNRSFDLPF